MMMMKNSKVSQSKLNNGMRRDKKQHQKSSPRSPLKVKDHNVSTSCSSSCSSTVTSISSDAPMGCLRFFPRNACNNKPKPIVIKTPKSAPNGKNLRGKSGDVGYAVKRCDNKQNPEKPISKRVQKLRKNPPLCSRSGLSDKLSTGLEVKLSGNAGNFTPVTKLGNGYGLDRVSCKDKALNLGENETDCSDNSSPIPPIQASVSPEIQFGSMSVVPATPNTCYGAGHVLSGVSDKRKCRPRGILTIGNNDLFGSCKSKGFQNDNEKDVAAALKNRRVSLIPSPTEASVYWLPSPCDGDGNGLKSSECEKVTPFKSIGCSSSPSSSLGFSSITNSDATTGTQSSGKSKDRDSISEFRGLLGPSFDHFVDVSPTKGNYRYDQAAEATPYQEGSNGSGNVIRTPQSTSSSPNLRLSREEISRLWFECELDSVAEVLRRASLDSPITSFEFTPLIKPELDGQIVSEIPESLLHDLPEAEVSVSWREGLTNRIFEMDELECCRCLSDEEEREEDLNDHDPIDINIEAEKEESNRSDLVDSVKIDDKRCDSIDTKGEETFASEGPEDAGWTACHQNHLFRK